MKRKADQLTESEIAELDEIYRSTYLDAYNEAFEKPLKFLHHDTDAHVDDELRLIASECGSLEIYGKYWVLMELLASRRGHIYDVSTDLGWSFLALDMSTCGVQISVDECKKLIECLVKFDKIDREIYNSRLHVVCSRVSRQADRYAEEYAVSKAAGAKSARKRAILAEKEP